MTSNLVVGKKKIRLLLREAGVMHENNISWYEYELLKKIAEEPSYPIETHTQSLIGICLAFAFLVSNTCFAQIKVEMRTDPLSILASYPLKKRLSAIHECGHAMILLLKGREFNFITVQEDTVDGIYMAGRVEYNGRLSDEISMLFHIAGIMTEMIYVDNHLHVRWTDGELLDFLKSNRIKGVVDCVRFLADCEKSNFTDIDILRYYRKLETKFRDPALLTIQYHFASELIRTPNETMQYHDVHTLFSEDILRELVTRLDL